ncbi:hypothetical protein KVF94_04200 [Streptococcus equi subsp. zooepidemicus]|uniref:DUF6994 family protein n=1 Tax=Streptococcus equi TaxID=1336 RepID=UPI001E2A6792|nr:hypothetical protein [Streptococcus equi]MCD3400968.1 hypothetical protein [Streptococcus equi subsp. zooepidemicus]
MKLEDFQTYPFKSVQEYILDKEKAVKFSFLLQGDEPDRSELTKFIYKEIFEWYDDKEHSGDTLITYRTAIFRKYYGKSYKYLPRETQKEILEVIQSHTNHDKDFPFEFELGVNGNLVNQICNNYQIGNFGIFPKEKINPARAQSPYNDFFDLALSVIWELYDGTLTPDDDFKKAVLDEKEYFDQFEDFETFISENFLSAFFDEEGYLIRLSEIDDFEEYVRVSNQIIYTRGLAILTYLQSRYDNSSELPIQQLVEEKPKPRPTTKESAYRTLEIVEEEIDKISKLDEHFNDIDVSLRTVKFEATKKRIHGSIVILLFILFLFFINSEIIFFIWILSIILYVADKIRMIKERMKYDKILNKHQEKYREEKKKLLATLQKEYFSIPSEFRTYNHVSGIRYFLNADIASNLQQAIHYYSNEYNSKMLKEEIYNLHHSNTILQDRIMELELEKERRELERYK